MVSSLYVASFPDNYIARDLYEVFKKCGEVDKVVIPYERDVWGKRYGFVWFFKVEDERRLAVELNNIFLRDRTLHMNVLRFSRNKHGEEAAQRKGDVRKRIGVSKAEGHDNPNMKISEKTLKYVNTLRWE